MLGLPHAKGTVPYLTVGFKAAEGLAVLGDTPLYVVIVQGWTDN